MSQQTFSKKLLTWYNKHGRKNLPWQQNKTPYRVWLSEIMLQQTQVKTVIPYFNNFIKTFPTINKLAKAPLDEILHLWSGLGYYSRARNLHKCASIIVNQHNSKFPTTLDELQQLPGIGRSTAAAILAISMNQPATILDGNVKRVLTRHNAIVGWPGKTEVLSKLWEIAESLTPTTHTADYTQAIMDLGATICTRSKPKCQLCPISKNCQAALQHKQTNYPTKKPSKRLPTKSTYMLILKNNHNILLEKRPHYGIWGALWSFPEIDNIDYFSATCEQRFKCKIVDVATMEPFQHTFSHYHLQITPILLDVLHSNHQVMENEQRIWYNFAKPARKGFATPVKRLLEMLKEQTNEPHDILY